VLILTRKAEQGIVIDQVTIVRILSIDGDRVKIGIDAPTSIPVLREELLNQVPGDQRGATPPADASSLGSQFTAFNRRRPQSQNGNGRSTGDASQAAQNVTPG
jgi:carbon storage regulator